MYYLVEKDTIKEIVNEIIPWASASCETKIIRKKDQTFFELKIIWNRSKFGYVEERKFIFPLQLHEEKNNTVKDFLARYEEKTFIIDNHVVAIK